MATNTERLRYTIVAILLILFIVNECESLGMRKGRIERHAKVHRTAAMGSNSVVGPFSVVRAGAYLHTWVRIGVHVIIEENVHLYRGSIVLDHAVVRKGALIGANTVVEQFSSIGRGVAVQRNSVIKQHATIMSRAKIAKRAVLGNYSAIGRRARVKEYAFVGQNSHIGSEAVVGVHAVVENLVIVPAKLKIEDYQIVIDPPETNILTRMLQERRFSKRFKEAVGNVTALSDSEFANYFSEKTGQLLADIKNDCKKTKKFVPQILYLVYAYLQKLHGEKMMEVFEKVVDVIVINGNNLKVEIDACQSPQRYNNIFDEKTKDKFLMMLAIFYDFHRPIGIKGEKFCHIVKQLLNNERSVLAVSDKCSGHLKVKCNGCADGASTTGPDLMKETDINAP